MVAEAGQISRELRNQVSPRKNHVGFSFEGEPVMLDTPATNRVSRQNKPTLNLVPPWPTEPPNKVPPLTPLPRNSLQLIFHAL